MTDMMQGFPPPEPAQVTLGNWRTAPFSAWAFHHVREILPTAEIPHAPASVRDLPAALQSLDGVSAAGASGRSLSHADVLAETDTDGLVILHQGHIIAEHYAHGMDARAPHILMSVSKSLLGLLAGTPAVQAMLGLERPITDLVPEMANGPYGSISIRHLLDMRAGIVYDENYGTTSGPIIAYRKAMGWNPLAPGDTPTDVRSFLATLAVPAGPHGGKFNYVSPGTDLLGWAIERAMGQRYADVMAEQLWQPMGAEWPASITVDRLGSARAAGGMSMATRDLARVGQLLVEGGARGRRQIVPEAWIGDLETGGDRAAWDQGTLADYYPGAAMTYRAKWYADHGPLGPLLFGMGIHGQNVFVDRRRQLVIAKFSSQAIPLDHARMALTMRWVDAVRTQLS
ncbi:MAG: serine hydrolase domain-containing protein [Hyphomicrobiaceae bacterium]